MTRTFWLNARPTLLIRLLAGIRYSISMYNKKAIWIFAVIFYLVAGQSCFAGESVYDVIAGTPALTKGYVVVKTKNGIDLNSITQYTNSNGEKTSVSIIVLEGPFKQFKTLGQGVDYLLKIIKPEVDTAYKANHPIYEGLDAAKVDIDGTTVGLFDYKLKGEPEAYVIRALMHSKKGLYSYSITMHNSHPKDKRGLRLVAIVIASVNSGKL